MSCCPVTATPALEGQGGEREMITYGKTSMYVTGPKTAKAGIIALPDIYGMDSGRSKSDADMVGKLGYAVVYVDLTDGDYMTPENQPARVGSWLPEYDFANYALAHINDAIQYLQQEAKVEIIASYGYCWGAYIGAHLSAVENPVITGHVSFHPSWIIENMLRGENAVEKLTEKIKVPQLLLAAGDEPDFVRSGGSVEKILKANPEVAKLSDVIDFPGMVHGWVHRADIEDPAVKTAVMKAWHAAVKFLQTVCPL